MADIKITILVDNPDSWIKPYVIELINLLKKKGYPVSLIQHYREIKPGDIAIFLSCNRIVPKKILSLNKHNLILHESAVPEGKGWSPLTWQILEGKNKIPISLFEADEKVDSGQIYFQDTMIFDGSELLEEIHDIQGRKTIDLCLKFIDSYPEVVGKAQEGAETFYPRRYPENSEIDVNQSIAELFNTFRVADNDRYPIFFNHKGYKYILKIEKVGKSK